VKYLSLPVPNESTANVWQTDARVTTPIKRIKMMQQPTIKTSVLTLVLMALSAAFTVSADEVQDGREMIREGRLEMVRSELSLTDAEDSAFWPVYSTYRAETDAIQDRYAAMIKQYMRRYEDADLSDEYADELMASFFGIKRELLDMQEKFLPQFRKVLPALKVARLFQLENKISAEIDAQLALVVPLVDPS
jgi:hypothetical protein